MLGLERLETRRIHADLIMCYKIIHQLVNTPFDQFLPARRYASAGLCDSDVSVCLSVCLSHAGIVPSRAKAGS